MNELTYSLEWRGARKSALSYADIEAGLVSGDLHTLYKIHVNGKWLVLRDFVEQQRPLLAPHSARQHTLPPPMSQPALLRPEQQSAVPPPTPQGKAVLPPASIFAASPAGRKAPKPVWFWPAIILSSTVCLLLGVVFVYMSATAPTRPGSQHIDDSSSDISSPTTSTKSPPSSDAARDKSILTSSAQHNLTNEEIANLKSPYVVMIRTRWMDVDKAGKAIVAGGNGSGVLIKHENGHAYFVTNKHVVKVPSHIEEVVYSLNFMGADHPFEVVKLGRYDLDLAMLSIKYSDTKDQSPLNSARLDDLKAGQECVAIGNALGQGISVTTGVISAFDEWEEGKYVRTSAPISSGNSGGGLFRTKDGALIGIMTLGSGSALDKVVQNINRAIPMDYVLSDLFWENF